MMSAPKENNLNRTVGTKDLSARSCGSDESCHQELAEENILESELLPAVKRRRLERAVLRLNRLNNTLTTRGSWLSASSPRMNVTQPQMLVAPTTASPNQEVCPTAPGYWTPMAVLLSKTSSNNNKRVNFCLDEDEEEESSDEKGSTPASPLTVQEEVSTTNFIAAPYSFTTDVSSMFLQPPVPQEQQELRQVTVASKASSSSSSSFLSAPPTKSNDPMMMMSRRDQHYAILRTQILNNKRVSRRIFFFILFGEKPLLAPWSAHRVEVILRKVKQSLEKLRSLNSPSSSPSSSTATCSSDSSASSSSSDSDDSDFDGSFAVGGQEDEDENAAQLRLLGCPLPSLDELTNWGIFLGTVRKLLHGF